MNPIKWLRLAIIVGLLFQINRLAVPTAQAEPPPPGPCTGGEETGPHVFYWCTEQFHYTNSIQLSWTNIALQLGAAIPRPVIVGALPVSGALRKYTYYDCDWNQYLDQTITNTTPSSTNWNYWGLPANATNFGISYYYINVSFGLWPECDPLTGTTFLLRVITWTSGDSDYDGISDYQEALNGTNPNSATNVNQVRLGCWPFDNTNTWVGSAGQMPIQTNLLVGALGWNTNAVRINSSASAVLKYRDVETNQNANINLRNGSIKFWFKPDWSSVNAGGAGLAAQTNISFFGTPYATGIYTLFNRGAFTETYSNIFDPKYLMIYGYYGYGDDYWTITSNSIPVYDTLSSGYFLADGNNYWEDLTDYFFLGYDVGAWFSTARHGIVLDPHGSLIEVGGRRDLYPDYYPPANTDFWSLRLDQTGDRLSMIVQTNGVAKTNFAASISWSSNVWHQVVLAYNITNTALYIDGLAVVTNGVGVTCYPDASVRTNGFTVGSDFYGDNQMRGAIDELETFNYPLSAANVYSNYQSSLTVDFDGDGVGNILELLQGRNPTVYGSVADTNNLIGFDVYTPLIKN